MVIGVQARPVLAVVRHEVLVVIARPWRIGAGSTVRVNERHLNVVGNAVAVRVDGVDAIQVEVYALDRSVGHATINTNGLEEVLPVAEVAPKLVVDGGGIIAIDDRTIEDTSQDASVERQFVAVPIEPHEVRRSRRSDRGAEERQFLLVSVTMTDANHVGVADHVEYTCVGARID